MNVFECSVAWVSGVALLSLCIDLLTSRAVADEQPLRVAYQAVDECPDGQISSHAFASAPTTPIRLAERTRAPVRGHDRRFASK